MVDKIKYNILRGVFKRHDDLSKMDVSNSIKGHKCIYMVC